MLLLLANLTWGTIKAVTAEECTSTVHKGPCDLASCTQQCQAEYSKDGRGKCVGDSPAQVCYCIYPC
ncbi:hypothetical protein K1719_023778 [Acacia pycnantha]|nr:hypothetical protein K1719_023778 [Acacia pycnantha]